jgi:hypothetical protein
MQLRRRGPCGSFSTRGHSPGPDTCWPPQFVRRMVTGGTDSQGCQAAFTLRSVSHGSIRSVRIAGRVSPCQSFRDCRSHCSAIRMCCLIVSREHWRRRAISS